ncbi:MAG: MFS transporter [bacterium]
MPVRFFQARGIYYGWVVIAVVSVTLFMVLGFRFAFGIFYVAILEETGWQRGETAAIFSVAMLVYAVVSVLSGAVFDWLGPRVLFPIGLVILAAGLALCSTISSLWEFYLYYGVLVGVAFSMLGFIPHMAFVPRWFVRRRGLAAAVALSGVGIGSLTLSIAAERLLEIWSWRTIFLAFGAVTLVVLVPLILVFHRTSPEAIGLHPDGLTTAPPKKKQTGLERGGFWWVLGTSRFWLLFVAVGMTGFGGMTMVVHQTRLLVDMGYTLALAAGIFGFTGLLRSVGGIFWGPLSDRIGRRFCIAIISLMGLVAVLLLLVGEQDPNLVYLAGFVVLWGAGFTSMAPVYASTVADLFPGRHLGKVMGMLDLGFGMGSASGPYLAGTIFDGVGSYRPMLWVLLGAVFMNGFALWLGAAQIPARPMVQKG